MKFSSISRLLNHTQRNDCSKITCKLCDETFTSNNRLHEHVRLHHNQKSPPEPATPQKAMIMRSGPHMPDTPPATPRLTPAIRTPSHQPITMMKAPAACSPSPSPRSPAPSLQNPHTTPKPYMTMNDLFAMFAGKEKRPRKSSDTIHKQMRSPRSPLPDQTQITSYFKPAGQPNPASTKAPISNVFTSSPCPAPRPCFSANRSAETPQNSKASKPAKLPKSLKSAVFISCPSSALRFYLSANQVLRTPQIADLLQQLTYLLRLSASAAADIDTSPPPAPPYEPMNSRRDDAEREREIV